MFTFNWWIVNSECLKFAKLEQNFSNDRNEKANKRQILDLSILADANEQVSSYQNVFKLKENSEEYHYSKGLKALTLFQALEAP